MSTLQEILEKRGLNECPLPLWKMRLSEDEYVELKNTLKDHSNELSQYGSEAALCYAEWWRRDYEGYNPSKEDVAQSIGLGHDHAKDLFEAAKNELIRRRCKFIRSLKGTEYFRTLLNQGGLPINYIKNNDSNLGSFTRFLKGLVRELSIINHDWNNEDHSIIQQLGCISYLSNSFKNENIYDVAMQIAHAIIANDTSLLPYDDTDASLVDLTQSLQQEYSQATRERRVKPLSLHWKFSITDDRQGFLLINLDVVKDISSDSIPGLNTSTCYSFDIFVAGKLVGKYVRKTINRDEEGNIVNAIYTRISVGINKDILWRGEPVVEVKVRCDNDDRIFLTVAGCYPPDFERPQAFQMIDENLFSRTETANTENNIVIFSDIWHADNCKKISIVGRELNCVEFSDATELVNVETGETVIIDNQFTPYIAEFSGNYIPWIEQSNYKLLNRIPVIRVYDKDMNQVNRCPAKYRVHGANDWNRLNAGCVLSPGLIDIKVEFPDGKSEIETFYSIGDLSFGSLNGSAISTEITCSCPAEIRPEIEDSASVIIENLGLSHWRISRRPNSNICPSTCAFRLYNQGNPILRVSIAIPFDGIMITDVNGKIVPNRKIISFANLSHYCVTNHGRNRDIKVSYRIADVYEQDDFKSISRRIDDDVLVSLADYSDLIMRMFNLYGVNSFDRSSSAVVEIPGQEIFIRKFILESTIEDGSIIVDDYTEDNTSDFIYDGDLFVFPVDDGLPSNEFFPIKLERDLEIENKFNFPEDFLHKEVVAFSGADASRRIIPKYFNRDEFDYDKHYRSRRTHISIENWYAALSSEDVFNGEHWRNVCIAYNICSQYNLPFTSYDGLKAVAKDPELIVNFVIAMWLNECKDVLSQDINRFEQEMVIAFHWISANTWNDSINNMIESIPEQIRVIIMEKMPELIDLLQDIFNSTVATDIAQEFINYIVSGTLEKSRRFSHADINYYRMNIRGLTDINQDLPTIDISVNRENYYAWQEMPQYCQVMIESAICAAENTCSVDERIDLFKSKGHASIVNFYRRYFKETYSEIFLKAVKIINSN